jgi:nucleoside-diphosphate-sugar epimerase
VRILEGDLRELALAISALEGAEIVFHLAASRGGRGYIETHPADCSSNMLLDGAVLRAAHLNGVSRFYFASSACVYPIELQTEGEQYTLSESSMDLQARTAANGDGEYGWSKLMGEMAPSRALRRQSEDGDEGAQARLRQLRRWARMRHA